MGAGLRGLTVKVSLDTTPTPSQRHSEAFSCTPITCKLYFWVELQIFFFLPCSSEKQARAAVEASGALPGCILVRFRCFGRPRRRQEGYLHRAAVCCDLALIKRHLGSA